MTSSDMRSELAQFTAAILRDGLAIELHHHVARFEPRLRRRGILPDVGELHANRALAEFRALLAAA